MKLEGKVAIVTAGGRGIGRGISLCLAEEGANVVVNSFHEETSKKVAEEIKAMGRNVLAIAGDITKTNVMVKVIEDTINTFGKIDILVNNVGGGRMTSKEAANNPLEQAENEWDETYEQNLKASVLMCKAVQPHFIKQKSGKIINIASVAADSASALTSVPYAVMKAGLIRFTQALANELGPYNINANCVCPGIVYTDAWQHGAKHRVENTPAYKGMQ
ncbi:MAG: SDR family NAD(P)-dependent oxidoreductase, partial [Dehalococcoidales bacterium]|nr:SDR family NAD(P)-dependent oxidoreductase [Dehalococcoidales bacterium]